MNERRKIKRIKKYFAINIVALDKNDKHLEFDKFRANPKFCDESGLDFSPKGIRIMCSKPLPEESRIQLKMLIPDKDSLNLIRANGKVRWFKEIKGEHKKYFIIGVAFKELLDEDKLKLLSLWKRYS